jgi:hypothetical protein
LVAFVAEGVGVEDAVAEAFVAAAVVGAGVAIATTGAVATS